MSKKKLIIPALLAGGAAVAAYVATKNATFEEESKKGSYVFEDGSFCSVYRERGPVNATVIGGDHIMRSDLICDNILSADKSCIVFDRNGRKYNQLKDTLKEKGFKVKKVDFVEGGFNCYNPLAHIKDDMDITPFVHYLMDLPVDDENDFFKKAEEMFVTACMLYLLEKEKEADLFMLNDMIPVDATEEGLRLNDEELSSTTNFFSALEETSTARKFYRAFLQAAGLSINDTIIRCKRRVEMLLEYAAAGEDKSGLADLRTKKEAIFVTYPAAQFTPVHEFYLKSFLTHAFKTLMHDPECTSETDPVCIFIDDYKYVKDTEMFVGTASIIRKYHVSLFVAMEDVQDEDINAVSSLICSSNACVYLGGKINKCAEHFLQDYFDIDFLTYGIEIKCED